MTKQGLPQFYRQRYILALLQIFNCELHRTDFQKYLFLANQEFSLTKEHYAFLPYNYGPFSFQAFADIRRLSDLGFIKSDDTIRLDSSIDYMSLLQDVDKKALEGVYRKYAGLKGQSLIRDVYTKYPYFACKSKILPEVMDNGINLPSFESSQALFSIGYEGRTIDQYLNILVKNNVSVLVDVRKNPISMKYGFSKSTLNNATKNIGINYLHVPDLGIESSERKNLNSYADYCELFDGYEKHVLKNNNEALLNITKLYNTGNRVALTCFERDVNYCHRSRISNRICEDSGILTTHL